MNTQSTINHLNNLRLLGMVSTYKSILELPVQQQPTSHELLARLAEAELQYRIEQRTHKLVNNSKLRYQPVPEELHLSDDRNLTRDHILPLLEGSYISKGETVLITGATGCGKSWLACTLGRQACIHGYKTLYFNSNKLIEKIALAKLDGSYLKLLTSWEKTDLIIIDDFGLTPLDHQVKLAFLQMLDDRYGRKGTIVASQIPVNQWFEYINEPSIADAFMDRVTANAHRIDLKGKSLRKKK